MNFKLAILKATAILTPTYIVAFTTEQMVYTMPMLAAVTVFVTTLDFDSLFKKKDDPVMSDGSTMTEVEMDSMASKDSIDIEGDS